MLDYFKETTIDIAGTDVNLIRIIFVLFGLLILFIAYKRFVRYLLKTYAEIRQLNPDTMRKIRFILRVVFLTLCGLYLVKGLGINFEFFSGKDYRFSLSYLFQTLFILELAWFINWIITRVILPKYFKSIDSDENLNEEVKQKIVNQKIRRSIQYAIFCLTILFILNKTNFDLTLFSFPIGLDNSYVPLRMSNIIFGVLIILIARIASWVITQFSLRSYYSKKNIDKGTQFAISQLITYVIFIIAVFYALQIMGFQITILIGGLAALLVGVGLGLQQTFNDLMSGIIILFERSVEVGDVVEINNVIGTVQHIGLRSSIIEGRDNVAVIVPNSKLVVDNVINWSHIDDKVRFIINVGVDYSTDPALVKKILLDIGERNQYILNLPKPIIRLVDFGDNALQFEILFWSRNFIIIENIKSDIRFEILAEFTKNDIRIPFPQRDIWMRTAGEQNKMEKP